MSVIDYMLKTHGRKTVTLSTVIIVGFLGWGGMEVGWIPMPASRAYVDFTVDLHTKGLSYLVEKELALDLDNLKLQQCDGDVTLGGILFRLEEQFVDLIGRSYVHKSCVQLQQ